MEPAVVGGQVDVTGHGCQLSDLSGVADLEELFQLLRLAVKPVQVPR